MAKPPIFSDAAEYRLPAAGDVPVAPAAAG